MELWKRNLWVIWVAQFLSVASFGFTMPFAPYFIQELGVTEPAALNRSVALFTAATPFTLALVGPMWGLLSDRYGRRLMVLRSHAGAVLVLASMGMVRSVAILIVLRLFQGALTGTVTAAQMMVAANTPDERSGYALGSLSAATWSGAMGGAMLGGVVAHLFGYRMPFFFAAGLQVLAFVLVLYQTREQPPERPITAPIRVGRVRSRLRRVQLIFPLLLLAVWVGAVRQFDRPFLPLLVQEIHGSLHGAALWTGVINTVMGLAGIVAGVGLGRMADRILPSRLLWIAAGGAAVFTLAQAAAGSFLSLIPARFLAALFAGGLEPVMHVWLVRNIPEHLRGEAFGWAGSARAIGWMLAPLAAGAVATGLGLRWVFAAGGILFLFLIPAALATARRTPSDLRTLPD